MGTNENRIRVRIMLPFFAVMAFTIIMFVASGHSIHNNTINMQVDTKLHELSVLFGHLIEEESKFLTGQLSLLVKDARLMKAWQDRDREKLYRLAFPLYEHMKHNFGVTHFYFINPDKVSFLRVHDKDRYGYVVQHHTLKEACKSSRISCGIELGKFGTFTLRVVHPYVKEGRIMGYLELGEEIEHLTPHLKEISGLDLVFTIDKSHLEKKDWEHGIKYLGKTDVWEDFKDFVVIDKTMHELSPQLIQTIEQCRANVSSRKNITVDDRTFVITSIRLVDAADKHVGSLIAMYDITEKIAASYATLTKALVIILSIVSILLVFYYKYSGSIQRELSSYYHKLENLVEERTAELKMTNENLMQAINDRKQAEEKKREMEIQLLQDQKMKAIGTLTAGISHEINNPLNIILGFSQLLLDEVDSDSVIFNDLKKIEKHARNCKRILGNLLQFARKTEIEIEEVDINKAVQDSLELVRNHFFLQNITIREEYSAAIPTVAGDYIQLQQVFVNLLNNACQAMPKGGVLTVRTDYSNEEKKIFVRISDTGWGIKREDLPYIFDPFFSTRGHVGGTGLGLSVSQGIIESHKGEISCQTQIAGEKGEGSSGTTFVVVLPFSNKLNQR